jgi:hypothetical protein
MKSIKINSVEEYINFLGERSSIMLRSVYRGQADHNWKLVPSFYRLDLEVYDNTVKKVIPNFSFVEENMLEIFYQKGISLLKNYDINSDLDLMVIGQHHGLPTRLLDWTENPLYALFFAVEDLSVKKNACVYEYIPTKLENYKSISEEINFKSGVDYWFVTPRHINERVKAQNGYFTLHPLSKSLEIKSFDELLKDDGTLKNLGKFIIPRKQKEKIKKELDKLNINKYTIYPDLDGLASKIKSDLTTLPFLTKGKAYVAKN